MGNAVRENVSDGVPHYYSLDIAEIFALLYSRRRARIFLIRKMTRFTARNTP